MSIMHRRFLIIPLALITAAAGCTPDADCTPTRIIRADEPVGIQIQRIDPALRGASFRVLLDFESAADFSFIAIDPPVPPPATAPTLTHTGRGAMPLPMGCRGFSVKLASVPSLNQFPDRWTLVGGYFNSQSAQNVTVSYEAVGIPRLTRTVHLPARHWVAAMLDVSTLADPNNARPPVGVLRFHFDAPLGPDAVYCDDVLLIDNDRTLSDAASNVAVGGISAPHSPATITQASVSGPSTSGIMDAADSLCVKVRGHHLIIDCPGLLHLDLPTAEGNPEGWTVREAGPMRVRLSCDQGPVKFWTIYSDGRAYTDGKFKPLVEMPAQVAGPLMTQQYSPADVEVPPELGRIDRATAGDENNDAYNEQSASYRVLANGPRIQVMLTPRTPCLLFPVIEIAGLPAGKVVGTVEGQLLDNIVRLQNGHVLVQIHSALVRPTTVNIRVQ